ncbi:hypothetical protein [Palleronia abyssalis]|uniref:Sulfotransferase domain-containing protein n=1 Tax=Palleronia abyssalis TaxID=1501240 RepID=A0A2R8C275_9RHOB|nr:hypothetical protein [Palleronia abyssalis]SPJ26501.1 hypothetical protein PAA8504_04363 [Palleronia abyssalis]
MELEPVREWRIHLGAHKTATTHLQDTIFLRRAFLRKMGIDYIPMRDVRALKLPPRPGRLQWRTRLGWPMRARLEDAIAPLRSGPGRVVISDENLLGWVRDLLAVPFYPNMEARLRPFHALCKARNVSLFLGLRNPATLLPSAYAQQLRVRPVPGGFEPICNLALRSSASWFDVVSRLRKTLPDASLTIWKFEDYKDMQWHILSQIVGTYISPGETLPPSASTRSPSWDAIEAIERIPEHASSEQHAELAAQIIENDLGATKFDPVSHADKERFEDLYQKELENIARTYPEIRFLAPEFAHPTET